MNRTHQELLEAVSCGLCGADDCETVYEAQYNQQKDFDFVERFRASGDELLIDRLVKCRRCGLQYVNPRLRGDIILTGYTEGEDPTYVSQLAARERTFDAALVEIEALAGGRGRLLDIGTAAGAFVAAAARRGWDAEGCEPNRWLAESGSRHYGIRIRQGSVFDQPYAAGSFDVVTVWDVIEHTTDPRAVLERCRELLKPGGLLIVSYPDIGSWIARLLGRRWLFLTSVHLWYFDRTTMAGLMESAGFDVQATRPLYQRLELDYVLQRASVVNTGLSRLARAVIRPFRLRRVQVPYWLGQTVVAAKRRCQGAGAALSVCFALA